MGFSRNPVGFHFMPVGSREALDEYYDACKLHGHFPGMNKGFYAFGEAAFGLGYYPDGVIIGRVAPDDDDYPAAGYDWHYSSADDCKLQTRKYLEKARVLWDLNKQWLTHVEPFNEPNTVDADQVKWMIYSGQYAMDLCESWGYKIGLFGFSSGCPDEAQMKRLLPVLDDMAKRGHILTMHDGPLGEPWSFRKQAPWGALRFTKWWEFAMEAGTAMCDVALTEDYAYAERDAEYWLDLEWYFYELAKWMKCTANPKGILLGAAMYTMGEGGMYGDLAGDWTRRVSAIVSGFDWVNIPNLPADTPAPPQPVKSTTVLVHIAFDSQQMMSTRYGSGAAMCANLEHALGGDHTPQDWFDLTGAGVGEYIHIWQLQAAAKILGYELEVRYDQALDDAKAMIRQGVPVGMLVNAAYLRNCGTKDALFVSMTGFDEANPTIAYIHDSYAPTPGVGGSYVMQTALEEAWSHSVDHGNPKNVMLVLKKAAAVPAGDGWCPFAAAKSLDYHNYWDGRDNHPVKAVVIHIADGPMTAIYPTFNREGGSSSHFAISKTGLIEQYVSIHDTAWANGLSWMNGVWKNPRGIQVTPTWAGIVPGINPNYATISIEHEGRPGEPWTPEMLAADVSLLKWITQETSLTWQAGTTLISHAMIDPVDRPNDPGNGITLQAIVNAVYGAPPPKSRTLVGLHMRADGPNTKEDFDIARTARIEAALIQTSTPPEDFDNLVALGVKPENILMRLFMPGDDPNLLKPLAFVNVMLGPLEWFLKKGGVRVQVHNEPNLPQEGLGLAWQNAREFAVWYGQVVTLLRSHFPDLLFGFPALSPQPETPQWIVDCQAAMRLSDWIGVHAYWTKPEQMTELLHGAYWQHYLGLGGLLCITEFADVNPLVPKVVKADEYVRYFAGLPDSVIMACCFVSSASNSAFATECWDMEMASIVGARR